MNHLRRITLAVAAASVMLLAAGGCSDDESVFNAEVGECIKDPGTGSDIESFDEVDCGEDHLGEIFFLFEHEGDDDDFPGADALQEEAAEECEGDEFEDYVGVPFDETAIFAGQVNPSEESWGEGDRETICILTIGEDVDESFEGNGEEFPLGAGGGTTDTTSGGQEEDFSALIDDCEGGDMAACDELYFTTPIDSPEEEIGATCGGRSDEPLNGSCESTFG